MYRARVMYEAAVEEIGKDVVAKSSENRRCRHSARPATTQTAPPSKDLIPRLVLTEAGAYPFALARLASQNVRSMRSSRTPAGPREVAEHQHGIRQAMA